MAIDMLILCLRLSGEYASTKMFDKENNPHVKVGYGTATGPLWVWSIIAFETFAIF